MHSRIDGDQPLLIFVTQKPIPVNDGGIRSNGIVWPRAQSCTAHLPDAARIHRAADFSNVDIEGDQAQHQMGNILRSWQDEMGFASCGDDPS